VHVQGADGEDLVAVDDLSCGVHREHAVAVPVERQSEVGAHIAHRPRQRIEMGRPAVDVDVHAVGLGADDRDARAQPFQHLWCGGDAGAVGAVDHQRDARQVRGTAADQRFDIPLAPLGSVHDGAEFRPLGACAGRVEGGLHRRLILVGELEAVAAEHLDAVVGERIVRRADHDAGGGVGTGDQFGDRRGGQDAQQACLRAGADKAGGDRALEHGAAASRVAPDEHAGAGVEPTAEGAPEGERQLRGQVTVGNTADAVGTEQRPRGRRR